MKKRNAVLATRLMLFYFISIYFKYYNYNNPVLLFFFFTELNAVHYGIAF